MFPKILVNVHYDFATQIWVDGETNEAGFQTDTVSVILSAKTLIDQLPWSVGMIG